MAFSTGDKFGNGDSNPIVEEYIAKTPVWDDGRSMDGQYVKASMAMEYNAAKVSAAASKAAAGATSAVSSAASDGIKFVSGATADAASVARKTITQADVDRVQANLSVGGTLSRIGSSISSGINSLTSGASSPMSGITGAAGSAVKGATDLLGAAKGGLGNLDKGLAGAINDFKFPSLGGSGEDAKPGIKQTKNVFVCSANDELSTVDVYKEKASGVINSITEKANSLKADLSAGFKTAKGYYDIGKGYYNQGKSYYDKGKAIYDKATSFVDKAKALTSGNGSIADRLIAGNSLLKGGLSDIGMGDLANSKIFSVITSNAPTLIKYNNAYTQIKSANLKDVNTVVGLVNTYTGKNDLFSVKDLGANVSFCADLVNQCTKYGVPNSFGELAAIIEKDSPTASGELAKLITPGAIKASDSKTLMEVDKFLGKGVVKSIFPGIQKQFADSYNRPFISKDPAKDKSNYAEIKTVYDTVDPGWLYTERDYGEDKVEVINLIDFMGSSDQFKEVITTGAIGDNSDAKYLLFINSLGSTTVNAELRQQFPMVIINPATQPTKIAIDPFTVPYMRA